MHIDGRGWVAVIEIVVYIPALLIALYICKKHGFTRSSGWMYTLILCVVRIAGSVCELLTFSNSSTSIIKTMIILDSIGLSPLLLATLGLLSRLNDWINARSKGHFGVKQFRLIQLLITLGLILAIAGGTGGSTNSDGSPKIATTSKVAIALYIVAFVAIVLVWLVSMSALSVVPTVEKRVAFAVLIALPFILVRLVYSACVVFLHSHLFNLVNGSVVVNAIMAVLMEFVVVAIYLLLGFFISTLSPNDAGPIATRQWKAKNDPKQQQPSQQPQLFNYSYEQAGRA
ncbi:hypothetical protein EG328_002368 [Venturia inaequalis]|uniref:DUF7702 domain-containing protein n=1 Tax=Venturia inaequalis TaxID=5025 RepID=A0A8H3YWR8_VENIN|nr:hypothetical protein EG328_002368 [Venturia inaequalis]RDI77242.1 hypothetical protein Vi05172_g12790 [Venturia inaequalis]